MTVTGCDKGSSYSITPAIWCRLWGVRPELSHMSATAAPATACLRQTMASSLLNFMSTLRLHETIAPETGSVSDELCACLHHHHHSCAPPTSRLQMPSPRQAHAPLIYESAQHQARALPSSSAGDAYVTCARHIASSKPKPCATCRPCCSRTSCQMSFSTEALVRKCLSPSLSVPSQDTR